MRARPRRPASRRCRPGIEHGTVTVVVEGEPFEVTTLREDVETTAAARRCASGAISRRTRGGATSPSMPSRSAATAPCTTMSAGSPTSQRGACASSASRRRASARTTCASCASSASTPSTATARSIPLGSRRALRERQGLAILSRERVRLEFLKLLAARRAVEVVETLALAGFALRIIRGVVELGRLSRAASFEHEEGGHPDPIHRLAALAVFVAEDADRLRELLRLSNAEHERLAAYSRLLAKLRSRSDLAVSASAQPPPIARPARRSMLPP